MSSYSVLKKPYMCIMEILEVDIISIDKTMTKTKAFSGCAEKNHFECLYKELS